MWPPQFGLGDRHLPLGDGFPGVELVRGDEGHTGDRGSNGHGLRRRAVEHAPDRQCRLFGRCVEARHTVLTDAYGSGGGDSYRPPDPSRVERGVDGIPVLEHAGDVPLATVAVLRSAIHFYGQQVFGTIRHRLGDVEAVTEEVPLGVAEVRPVEPHVGLVEDPVEIEPSPGPRRRRGIGHVVEPCSVQQRVLVVGECRAALPVAGNHEVLPGLVVEALVLIGPTKLVVAGRRPPGTTQLEIHRGQPSCWATVASRPRSRRRCGSGPTGGAGPIYPRAQYSVRAVPIGMRFASQM